MNKLIQLILTLSYLKPKQAYYFIRRRFLPEKKIKYFDVNPVIESLNLQLPIKISGIYIDDYSFRFLNTDYYNKDNNLDWCPKDMSRLWQYNLHYFDYLREEGRSSDNKIYLVHDWIKKNELNSKPGWEPYTTSLRLVNWLIFLISTDKLKNTDIILSIYNQAAWLEHNLEKHILANHYFENIKALFFCSYYFNGDKASTWRQISERALVEQLGEQFLDDGGHFERTPQYHCRMLENCLDLFNLLKNNQQNNNHKLYSLLKITTVTMLEHLAELVNPDGTLPLFNDTALSSSEYPNKLFDYASRLGFEWNVHRCLPDITELNDTGLYGFTSEKDRFLIDCGNIGPSYQPGHSHCDFLSYELMVNNEPLVVDSGVYEYQAGDMRKYVRSTRAHNTVGIDNIEQSEIWGEFRVARRAKKINSKLVKNRTQITFDGEFQGFHQLGKNVRHRRIVSLGLNEKHTQIKCVNVTDSVSGYKHQRDIYSYIHLHPDFHFRKQTDNSLQILKDSNIIAIINVDNNASYRIQKSWYCPEFGLRYKNDCLALYKQTLSPAKLGYTINII